MHVFKLKTNVERNFYNLWLIGFCGVRHPLIFHRALHQLVTRYISIHREHALQSICIQA